MAPSPAAANSFTKSKITTEGALAAELAHTQEREYAVDEEVERQGS